MMNCGNTYTGETAKIYTGETEYTGETTFQKYNTYRRWMVQIKISQPCINYQWTL